MQHVYVEVDIIIQYLYSAYTNEDKCNIGRRLSVLHYIKRGRRYSVGFRDFIGRAKSWHRQKKKRSESRFHQRNVDVNPSQMRTKQPHLLSQRR